MPFKIHRTNADKGTTDIAAPEYTTGEAAFRAAMANYTQFVINHWELTVGSTIDGPAVNTRFKLYTDRLPGSAKLELRYDYLDSTELDPSQRDKTNHIIWHIVSL